MKKKLILLLLLISCFMTFQGCGKSQEEHQTQSEKDDSDEKSKKHPSNSSKKDKDESSEENKDAKNKLLSLFGKEDLSPLPVIRFEQQKDVWLVPDSTDILCEMTYETVQIENPEYAALSEALTSYVNTNTKATHDCAVLNVDTYYQNEYLQDSINEYTYFTFDTYYTHTRFDHEVLSVLEFYSDYQLGAHGSYYYNGITFDVETGNQLALTDLVQGDYTAFESFVKEYMVAELLSTYEEALFSPSELPSTINSYQLGEDIPWYLNGSGICFIFNTYSIGPYAMGAAEVCVPYTELTSYLKEVYLPGNGTYIAKLSPNISSCYGRLQPDNSKKNSEATDTSKYQTVCINTNFNTEYDDASGVSVSTVDSEEILTDYGYFQSAYLVRKSDGNDYLFTCIDLMSGDYETTLYQINNGVLTQINQLSRNCLEAGTVFEDSFSCTTYFDVLGTYNSTIEYIWNDDNTFTPKEDVYYFNTTNWGKMTTQIPLPVIMNGESTQLPTGTTIQIIGYDGDSTAFFRIVGTEDTGEINVIREDYKYLIDGISEYDYFDFVPYAG